MKKIKEHDIVIVETENLERFGCVVHIYPNTAAYKVEFVNQLGESYVETIQGEQITMVLK